MSDINHDAEFIRQQYNLQTAQIAWRELQRYFAAGAAIQVSAELDLLDVAVAMNKDNKAAVEQWITEKKIDGVSDVTAKKWFDEDTVLWAVVVKPWVLVQEKQPGEA